MSYLPKSFLDSLYATLVGNGAISQILQWTSARTAKWVTMSGDATIADGGAIAVNKTRLNVRNETGVTIPTTTAVYSTGFNNLPLILLADNTDETKHNVIGVTVGSIAHQADGYIATGGQCDAETNGWVVGTELYLSTAGALTATEPTSGSVQHVGIVTVQANYPAGKLLIFMQPEGNTMATGVGQDAIIRTGDNVGAKKVSFRNYSNTEVAYINSNGLMNISSGTYNVGGIPHLHSGTYPLIASLGTAAYVSTGTFAPVAKGVTNGDAHDHLGGDGGQIAYTSLTGTYSGLSAASPIVYASGTFTWTKPANFDYLIVEVVGGGGGGGGAPATGATTFSVGGGAGGGGYAKKRINNIAASGTFSVSVGAGGAGSAGATGTFGGTSSFGPVSATGGEPGAPLGAFASGAMGGAGRGGIGSGGDINSAGSVGGMGARAIGTTATGGNGGGSLLGGGGIGTVVSTGKAVGGIGQAYGGGGAGASNNINQTSTAGGNGAIGVVIVWEYLKPF